MASGFDKGAVGFVQRSDGRAALAYFMLPIPRSIAIPRGTP